MEEEYLQNPARYRPTPIFIDGDTAAYPTIRGSAEGIIERSGSCGVCRAILRAAQRFERDINLGSIDISMYYTHECIGVTVASRLAFIVLV
jgi:hypothetical protein